MNASVEPRWHSLLWKYLRQRFRWRYVFLLLLGALLLWQLVLKPDPLPVYVTDTVIRTTVENTVSVTGSVQSAHLVPVQSVMAEQITAVHVAEGDYVMPGQLLVELGAEELWARLSQANAGLQQAEAAVALAQAGASAEQRALAAEDITAAEQLLQQRMAEQEQAYKGADALVAEAVAQVTAAREALTTAATQYENALAQQQASGQSASTALEQATEAARLRFLDGEETARRVLSKANSILQEDRASAEASYYGFANFGEGNNALQSAVRHAYGQYRVQLSRFEATVSPAAAVWSTLPQQEQQAVLRALQTLLDQGQTLTEDVTTLISYTTPTSLLPLQTIEKAQADLQAFLAQVTTTAQSIEAANQAITTAALQEKLQGTQSSSSLTASQGEKDRLAQQLLLAEQSLERVQATAAQQRTQADTLVETQRLQLSRAQAAYDQVAAGPRSVDMAGPYAQVALASAQVEEAELLLSHAYITSPIEGIVSRLDVQVGQRVQPAQTVALVLSPRLEIVANVSETDIAALEVGQQAHFTLDAFGPREVFTATVSQIDRAETVVQGVIYYQVTLSLDEDYAAIRSGMTANLDIIAATVEDALAVAPQAVTYRPDGTATIRVLLPGEDYATEREITTGLEGEALLEVTGGLEEGDTVVLYEEE